MVPQAVVDLLEAVEVEEEQQRSTTKNTAIIRSDVVWTAVLQTQS